MASTPPPNDGQIIFYDIPALLPSKEGKYSCFSFNPWKSTPPRPPASRPPSPLPLARTDRSSPPNPQLQAPHLHNPLHRVPGPRTNPIQPRPPTKLARHSIRAVLLPRHPPPKRQNAHALPPHRLSAGDPRAFPFAAPGSRTASRGGEGRGGGGRDAVVGYDGRGAGAVAGAVEGVFCADEEGGFWGWVGGVGEE